MNDTESAALAEALATARLSGATVGAQSAVPSLAEAYAIQADVAARLDSSPVGWKVGSTSIEAQQRLGTTQPGAGRLLKRFCFPDGAEVPVFTDHDVQVEVEFAFRIGATLPPRASPYDQAEIAGAVASFIPAFELVGTRFAAGLAGAGRELVTADGGANIAFVAGPECALGDVDLAASPCELQINGERVAAGQGSRALGHPFVVLTWLANFLRERDRALEAGEVVTTGTCTGLEYVKPGDHLLGDFGALGQVHAHIVAG
ncbi:MAG: fumarylacetoacetate hydrolase family protein [Pseudomonadota bacterium]